MIHFSYVKLYANPLTIFSLYLPDIHDNTFKIFKSKGISLNAASNYNLWHLFDFEYILYH